MQRDAFPKRKLFYTAGHGWWIFCVLGVNLYIVGTYKHVNSSPTPNPHPHSGQNSRNFAQVVSNVFSWMKSFVFWLKFHWSLFFRAQLIITMNWLGTKYSASHYLNQFWPDPLPHVCNTMGGVGGWTGGGGGGGGWVGELNALSISFGIFGKKVVCR